MKISFVIQLLIISSFTVSEAQNVPSSINQILRSVEKNNKELQSERYLLDAHKMENSTMNNLPDPTLNYSSFYTNSSVGDNGTEFVATQGFDFPTQYIARNKQIRLQNRVLDSQFEIYRRDILLRAKNLCLDLILLNQQMGLMNKRKNNADRLLSLYEKKMSRGDANILDVNKIKIERMNIFTEITKNNSSHRVALQSLLAMNGYLPLEFSETLYPQIEEINDINALRDIVIPADCEILSAKADARAAEKQIDVDKQGWLPKLEVGYRRNTTSVESQNGFVVGGTLPIFQNRKRVKMAKAMAVSSKFNEKSISQKAESNLAGLFSEMRQLKMAINNYDISLLNESLQVLDKSLDSGEISLINYFLESEEIYKNMLAYMELENQYQKIMAEIYKNDL